MATPFSYAQAAAKAQSLPRTAAPQSVSSQSASVTSSQSRDTTIQNISSAASAVSAVSNNADAPISGQATSVQSDSTIKPCAIEATHEVVEDDAPPPTPALTEAPQIQNQDLKKQSIESLTPNSERRSKTPNSSARASDTSDVRKPRKGKKSKGAEKDTEQDLVSEKDKESDAGKVVELRDSLPPTVNVWAARAAERNAATAAKAVTGRGPATSANIQSPSAVDARSRPAVKEPSDSTSLPVRQSSNGAKPQRGGNEPAGNDPASRRSAPRGSRANDKEKASAKFMPPSVADVISWPTVESAATGLKAQEKPEKQEAKDDASDGPKPESGPKKKKEWVAVDIVPTVKFNTVLPKSMGAGGRGGREGARGGRDIGVRGNARASNSAERTQTTTAARNIGGDGNQAGRPTSTSISSHAAGRPSVDLSAPRETRTISGQPSAGATKVGQPSQANGKSGQPRQNHGEVGSTPLGQNQAFPEASANHGQRADSSSRPVDASQDASGHINKDANPPPTRAEMGRSRGGHRGRSGHAGANGQGHQSHASYSSQSFAAGPASAPPRQGSFGTYPMPYPFANGNGRRSSNAGYPRAQQSRNMSRAAPAHAANIAYDPNAGYPPTGFPVQNMQYYGNSINNEGTMYDVIRWQFEYYFSVDNLVKDEWLRKNMDGQGFVPLTTIAKFKRMQQLGPSRELLRTICQQSSTVEYVVDAEGRELVRPHQEPLKWVMADHLRLPWPTVDEGHDHFYPMNGASQHAPYMMQQQPQPYYYGAPPFPPNDVDLNYGQMNGAYGPPMSNGVNHMSNGVDTNGVNGHHLLGETQLSAAVPAFQPNAQAENNVANGLGTANGKASEGAPQPNGADIAQVNGSYEQPNHPHTNGVTGRSAEDL